MTYPQDMDNICETKMKKAAPQDLRDRYEWQGMLASVLTGEVLRMEKRRLSGSNIIKDQVAGLGLQIWYGVRARLRGRTVSEEKRYVDEARSLATVVYKDLLNFQIGPSEVAWKRVRTMLRRIEEVESLYPSYKALIEDKPMYASPDFERRYSALLSWMSISEAVYRQFKILQDWTGSETLQITRSTNRSEGDTESAFGEILSTGTIEPSTKYGRKIDTVAELNAPFIERILKEIGLQKLFQKTILNELAALLRRAKAAFSNNADDFQRMGVPVDIEHLHDLLMFASNLMKECIDLRLKHAQRLTDPTPNLVDQLLDDFRSYIHTACMLKREYQDIGGYSSIWTIQPIDHTYDQGLLDILNFYFELLRRKIERFGSNSVLNYKQAEIMDSEWTFIASVVNTIEKGEHEASVNFSEIHKQLLIDLKADIDANFSENISPANNLSQVRVCSRFMENIRFAVRKIARFGRVIASEFCRAIEYDLEEEAIAYVLHCFQSCNYVLLSEAVHGDKKVFMLGCPDTIDRPDLINRLFAIIYTFNVEPAEYKSPHLVAITATADSTASWTGRVMEMTCPNVCERLAANRLMLVSDSVANLAKNRPIIEGLMESINFHVTSEWRVPFDVQLYDQTMSGNQVIGEIAEAVVDSVKNIWIATQAAYNVELMATCFSFATEFGQRVLKMLDINPGHSLSIKLMQLAIDWVSFICDNCDASDRKTFRWAVLALEFAMHMTRGSNILLLKDAEFATLRSKVAVCMTLLISHFDIQGVRSRFEAKLEEDRLKLTYEQMPDEAEHLQITLCTAADDDDESKLRARQETIRNVTKLERTITERSKSHKYIGQVLDVGRPEDESLVFLASSASNISLRWQQGKYLGGGTFGSVYLAINLDSGELMAVKEIRIQDTSSLSTFHKSIRDEMRVLEMLDHPNVVSYYGIEVHREKVYIFMEYCEGGNLVQLLEHGRIDDEEIIKLYTMQMLKGLEYLHSNNVIHRDVKPDNILLDSMGNIKFVDFGAAKVLAQKTHIKKTTLRDNVNSLAGTPMYMVGVRDECAAVLYFVANVVNVKRLPK